MLSSVRLRTRLEEIEEQILLLQDEREDITATLTSAAYPILSLPVEITSEIFLQCLDGRPIKPDLLQVPLVLTRVCSAWRKIALNIPRLWSCLTLVFDESPPVYRQPSAALVDTWLARGGSTPLVMDVNYVRSRRGTDAAIPPLLRDILHHSSRLRWKEMSFALPFTVFGAEFCAGMDVPALESLTLVGPLDDSPVHIAAFRDAPRLRVVHLNITPRNITLPWAQLTHFSAHYYSPKNCHKVLQLARTIIKCSFRYILESNLDSLPDLHLENLEDLTLSGSVSLLSCCLHLPKLQRLEFEERSDYLSEVATDLRGLLSRAPEITQLVCYADSEALQTWGYAFEPVSMLEASTKLAHLELAVFSPDGIIRALHDTPSFLPQIQTLKLKLPYSIHVDEIYPLDCDVLADALAARWRPSPGVIGLETFSIVWELEARCKLPDRLLINPVVFNVGERLSELKAKGMNIHIRMDMPPGYSRSLV
ncbi:hypothetical protein FB451DRAFT_305972 [Mycena latifolia]|nr:hypothetical protein FB451DRAFT_305972 [Mycena latifolia]